MKNKVYINKNNPKDKVTVIGWDYEWVSQIGKDVKVIIYTQLETQENVKWTSKESFEDDFFNTYISIEDIRDNKINQILSDSSKKE